MIIATAAAERPPTLAGPDDAYSVGPDADRASLVLRRNASSWTLEPVGITLVPLGLERDDVDAVRLLLDAVDAEADGALPATDFADDEPAFVVRLLGPAEVQDRAGATVVFERAKSLELLCWLALHRTSATRTAARAALWDGRIRDATFSNVVSEARRALARRAPAGADDEWVRRVNGDQLRLHAGIGADADVLERAVVAVRAVDDEATVSELRSALALVRGVPLASGYAWADAEGITARLTMLVLAAACDLGERELARGDVDGVLWATGVGLGVVPGHDELIALRMQAYANAGDLAGVRSEWEGHERAIAADPWAFEVSPRLATLRQELLHPVLSNRP